LGVSAARRWFFPRAGDEVDEDDQLAKANTKRFYEHVESLTVLMKKGAQLT